MGLKKAEGPQRNEYKYQGLITNPTKYQSKDIF